uniref:ARAD1D32274p n=1 Tax=Blastobotrys adeninivorans TaxID=409370 RepID=A0A060TB57_BLAAD
MTDKKFKPRVAFDTFDNKEATDFSLTLRSTHEQYKYARLSRTFVCAADDTPYSATAVEWLFDELAEDGDEIVCVRAIDPNASLSVDANEEKRYRDEAQDFFDRVVARNAMNKKVSIALEFAVGKVEDIIRRMIQIYEPSILVVGTRGRSYDGFKGLLPGSVSKWCLQHSPVPVVVVRPSQKRAKRMAKRQADPTRKGYRNVLSVAGRPGDVKTYDKGSTDPNLSVQLPHYLMTSLSKLPPEEGYLLHSASTPNLAGANANANDTDNDDNTLHLRGRRHRFLGDRLDLLNDRGWLRSRSRDRDRDRDHSNSRASSRGRSESRN